MRAVPKGSRKGRKVAVKPGADDGGDGSDRANAGEVAGQAESGPVGLLVNHNNNLPAVMGRIALDIHTAETAERIALRVKDPKALTAAISAKLGAQRQYAKKYTEIFIHGGDRRSEEFQVDSTDHLKREEFCRRDGFIDRTVRRWVERLLDDARFRVELVERMKKVWRILEVQTLVHVNENSRETEWYTPAYIIEAARKVMGEIDLDPASSPASQERIKALDYYTREQDGLSRPWPGRVWLNPPYSQPAIDDFCLKLEAECGAGNTTQAVIITNNGTETHWGQVLLKLCTAVCFHDGRVRFWAPDRESVTPLQGQMISYYGPEVVAFCREFALMGSVFITGKE